MIPRYSRPVMTSIWEPETRFRIWFEIEAHAATAMSEIGIIPKSAAAAIWDKGSQAKFNVARIDEIEAVTKHDVIAFLTHLAEFIGMIESAKKVSTACSAFSRSAVSRCNASSALSAFAVSSLAFLATNIADVNEQAINSVAIEIKC